MKTEQDFYQNSAKTNELRHAVETRYGVVLAEQAVDLFDGIYMTRLSHPAQMTNRLLNGFCAKGTVLVYPKEDTAYGDLKEFRATDGAINLSAMHLTKTRPESVVEERWNEYQERLKKLFRVLRVDCITPAQRIVADVQRSFGHGAPKISKQFGGDVEDVSIVDGDVLAVMDEIIKIMIETWQIR